MSSPDGPILLFDGVCTLCDRAVQFVVDRDSGAVFRFASLQSDAGRKLAADRGLDASRLDTLVLIDGPAALTRSTAVLGVARYLGPPWSWAVALRVVPRPMRDAAYDVVSRNRLRWFGQRTACRVPTPDLRHRFLGP